MDGLISIIVPIYNVEKYLSQCLDSILAQTYKMLEIILVDDGSPDICGQICDDYASRDSRIRVIHKTNGGLSSARNAGLEIATGDYVGFVDSDDWIAKDMYEYLLQNIICYNADIAECGYFEVFPDYSIRDRVHSVQRYNDKDALAALLELKIGNYSWNKLYRRELFEDIRFPEGMNYEDVRTTYRLFQKSHSVISLSEAKYFYRQNKSGIVSNPSIGNKISCVESRMSRYRVLNEAFPNLRPQLLREIYSRYCMELRDSICSRSKEEFESQRENLSAVTQFLSDYREDILQYTPRRLDKAQLKLMCNGTRKGWLLCGKIAKMQALKAWIDRTNTGKRYIKKRKRYKARTRFRSYYEKCLRLPLNDNLALLESRGGQDFASNILFIAKELQKHNVHIILSVSENDLPRIMPRIEASGIQKIEYVFRKTKPYYKAFATAKYLFNDMVYDDTIIKREGQIWTNVWHGTPLKCLEFDVKNQRHELGGGTREFLRTDYLAVPSMFMLDKLVDSARVRNLLTNTKALYCGYPRNQVFFDDERRKELRIANHIQHKEVFVYMPTWRGTFYDHGETEGEYSLINILRFFEDTLNDKQILYVKLHNYDMAAVSLDNYTKIRPFPITCDSYEFLNTADCLITDYSSVFFDFANTGRKTVLFVYDRDEYLRTRGIYVPLEDLPFPKVYNYDELRLQLNLVKDYDDASFRETYCIYDCADAAKKLVNHVLGIAPCAESTIRANGKKNILYYDARFLFRPYKPEKAQDVISSFKPEEANYYYSYRMKATKRCPKYLENLPPEFGPFVLSPFPVSTSWQYFWLSVFHIVTSRLAKHEANREMYGLPFDEIHIIDPNPFDEYVHLLNRFQNSK